MAAPDSVNCHAFCVPQKAVPFYSAGEPSVSCMKKIVTIIIAMLSLTISAVSAEQLKAIPSKSFGFSAELMVVSVGPSEPIKDSNNPNRLERMFRVSNYVSEIYLTVFIEEISVGEENYFSIYKTRKIESNFPGLMEEIKWLSATELEFKVAKKNI